MNKRSDSIEKKKKEMLEIILKMHDIELEVSGCGCCSSPNFTFKYKGEVIFDQESSFDFCNLKDGSAIV